MTQVLRTVGPDDRTSCCGVPSTYLDDGAGDWVLCCRGCHEEVELVAEPIAFGCSCPVHADVGFPCPNRATAEDGLCGVCRGDLPGDGFTCEELVALYRRAQRRHDATPTT